MVLRRFALLLLREQGRGDVILTRSVSSIDPSRRSRTCPSSSLTSSRNASSPRRLAASAIGAGGKMTLCHVSEPSRLWDSWNVRVARVFPPSLLASNIMSWGGWFGGGGTETDRQPGRWRGFALDFFDEGVFPLRTSFKRPLRLPIVSQTSPSTVLPPPLPALGLTKL